MLSQKAKNALRAVLLLAGSESPLTAREVAEREGISVKFLEATFVVLRDAGIVISRRGRPGGYRLARSPAHVSFGEVIRAIDGPLAPIRCASRTQFEPCTDCADVETCPIRWSMTKARDAIAGALDGCSLHDALHQTPSEDISLTRTAVGSARVQKHHRVPKRRGERRLVKV